MAKRRTKAQMEGREGKPLPVREPSPMDALYLLRNKLTSLRASIAEVMRNVDDTVTWLEALSDNERQNVYILALHMPETVDTLPAGEFRDQCQALVKLIKVAMNYSITVAVQKELQNERVDDTKNHS